MFDLIGVAVTVANEEDFHAQASKKLKGAKTIAISNVIGSSITREADYSIYTHAGPEIAVASTKAYTSQVVLLNILAMYFAEKLEIIDKDKIFF